MYSCSQEISRYSVQFPGLFSTDRSFPPLRGALSRAGLGSATLRVRTSLAITGDISARVPSATGPQTRNTESPLGPSRPGSRRLWRQAEVPHRSVGCVHRRPPIAQAGLRRPPPSEEAPRAQEAPTATHRMAAPARPPRPPLPSARAGGPTPQQAGGEAGKRRPGAAERGKVCRRCPRYIRRRGGAARLPHGGAGHGRAALQAAPHHAARLPGAPPVARQPRQAELPARRGGRPVRGHRRPAGARLLPAVAGKAGRAGAQPALLGPRDAR